MLIDQNGKGRTVWAVSALDAEVFKFQVFPSRLYNRYKVSGRCGFNLHLLIKPTDLHRVSFLRLVGQVFSRVLCGYV